MKIPVFYHKILKDGEKPRFSILFNFDRKIGLKLFFLSHRIYNEKWHKELDKFDRILIELDNSFNSLNSVKITCNQYSYLVEVYTLKNCIEILKILEKFYLENIEEFDKYLGSICIFVPIHKTYRDKNGFILHISETIHNKYRIYLNNGMVIKAKNAKDCMKKIITDRMIAETGVKYVIHKKGMKKGQKKKLNELVNLLNKNIKIFEFVY